MPFFGVFPKNTPLTLTIWKISVILCREILSILPSFPFFWNSNFDEIF